jgi:hypothetical protein
MQVRGVDNSHILQYILQQFEDFYTRNNEHNILQQIQLQAGAATFLFILKNNRI